MTYDELEKRYSSRNVNRRCIDGTVTGKGKCVGYCLYEEHPGYLTKELLCQHECEHRECRHYLPKVKSPVKVESANPFHKIGDEVNEVIERILAISQEKAKRLDGLLFLKASMVFYGVCELSYVSVSDDYPWKEIAESITKEVGWEICFSKLDYSWDRIEDLMR